MDLKNLSAPLTAAANGLWRGPWPETGDLELKVRPFTEAYQAELARSQAEVVRQARADGRLRGREGWEDLPLDFRLAHARNLMLDRLLVDVRGLTDEGSAVTVEQYRGLAKDYETWATLADTVNAAVVEVTTDRAALRKAAGGNSARGSGSNPAPANPS